MSGFDPQWLALREPFDQTAREAAAAHFDWPEFTAHLRSQHSAGAALQVIDLGCGTGASLRALAPRLGGQQHWRLIDHDLQLLAALPQTLARWATAQGGYAAMAAHGMTIELPSASLNVSWQRADLNALHTLALERAQLVTASALLDLVSLDWLQALVERCAVAGAAVCWALTVDARVQWLPGDSADAVIDELFKHDQQRDKGFGPCLGGAAPAAAVAALTRAGYHVQAQPSDWHMSATQGSTHRAMLRAMIDGAVNAALLQSRDSAETGAVQAWQQRRLAQLEAPTDLVVPADPTHLTNASDAAQAQQLQLQVGHIDVLAWPQRAA